MSTQAEPLPSCPPWSTLTQESGGPPISILPSLSVLCLYEGYGLGSLAQILSLCAASCVPAKISYSLSPLLILPLAPPSLQPPALGSHPKKAADLSFRESHGCTAQSFCTVWADGNQG